MHSIHHLISLKQTFEKGTKLSVTYQHGTLLTDISNLQTSEIEILEINWFGKPLFPQEEILSSLKSHKFQKVKRLVLNNLFYSRKFVQNLVEKFRNIEYLKILPFNSAPYNSWTNFMGLTALRKLEMTLGFSGDIVLIPPKQLKELTLSISKMASKQSAFDISQLIDLTSCISLESL